jgi:ABC-type antimicrobial peptide transport system permease subunit
MALGAERSTVLRLVLRQGLAMAAAGVALGGLAAFWISRLIASQLYEISPTDPIAFVGATALLVAVAALACFVPARRATRVEPMVALHYE